MATKFIQLDEAAKTLGITVEQLLEMRSRNEVRGFRDGATWKFKSDDIDKLVETVSAEAPAEAGNIEFDSDLDLSLEDDSGGGSELTLGDEATDDGDESVLLSERELGGSDVTSKSTIIDDTADSPSDSDITLADAAAGASDVQLVGDSMIKGSDIGFADSDIGLGTAEEPASDAKQPRSEIGSDAGSDLSLNLEEIDTLDLDAATPDIASSPSSNIGSDLSLTADSGLSLEEAAIDFDSGIGDSEIQGKSSIELSDDDDLVLGEGSGSDITTSAGDSGISLMDPADSGLSLEEAPIDLDLSGSAIDESLVLGEDDMITLGDDLAGASGATELKMDDDFLLTPLDDGDDDLSESGSQVIPLDETGIGYDQSAATMLNVEGQAGMDILEEDLSDAQTMIGGVAAASPLGVPQPAVGVMMQPVLPEAPYSVWNLLSLLGCVTILCLSGMLIYDVVRQMWSWQGTYPVNSDLMEAIVNIFQ
ncbi:MAG: hypothetical protein WBF93_04900 [Pirellulales bacterium]